MSTPKELQEEEYEVLKSIYEGDQRFTEVSPTTFCYKFEGEENPARSFIVEFSCGKNYPEDPPSINLDVFYNSSLNQVTKNNIKSFLDDQATPLLGSAMIYTLIESIKEHVDQLMVVDDVPDEPIEDQKATDIVTHKRTEKKEQLTKAQKRKLINRQEKGEYPRGWNWVDIISHLSSTSQKSS